MALYIWLLWHQLVIFCAVGAGCLQTSMAHFDNLMAAGALELLFEVGGIIKIFSRKNQYKYWKG